MWWYYLPLLVPLAYGLLILLIRWASPVPQLGVGEDGKLQPCPNKPNCVCSQTVEAGHQVQPLVFTGSPEQAWQQLRKILDGTPRLWIVEETNTYLRAEVVTLIWRFIDDLEFLLDGPGQVIHCRSASRLGYSDLGVNRRRIDDIRAAFVVP